MSIIEMHEDLNPYSCLSVGFNDDKFLVFKLSVERLEDNLTSAVNLNKYLVVGRKGIDMLTERMNVSMTKLPIAFRLNFGRDEESWNTGEVSSAFDGIRHYLSKLNIHFHIKTETV